MPTYEYVTSSGGKFTLRRSIAERDGKAFHPITGEEGKRVSYPAPPLVILNYKKLGPKGGGK